MNKTNTFDVLVVYTDAIAKSASCKNVHSPFEKSFGRSHYDNAYSYFLKTCKENNLSAAFSTSSDIIDAGKVGSYWQFSKNSWKKVNKPAYSTQIFDKLSPVNSTQKTRLELLFSEPEIKSFNSPYLFQLFFDKQKTYDELSDFVIPTISVASSSNGGVKHAIRQIRKLTSMHPNAADFSQKLVLKDRFGSGGNNVFLIGSKNPSKEITSILKTRKGISFILQPFAKFETGYMYKGRKGFTDIRIIYMGQKVKQVYIRMAKDTDFRCNEHQGGKLLYISQREVPAKVRKFAHDVATVLDNHNELYALDLVVSNAGNVFLMEGNIRPGLDWNLARKKNERMAKKLIREIVKELKKRVRGHLPKFPSEGDLLPAYAELTPLGPLQII